MKTINSYGEFLASAFSGFEERIELISDGICRDRRMDLSYGQKEEHAEREHIASSLINIPEKAFNEAINHHSLWVMRSRASSAIKSLRGSKEKNGALLIDLGCGFGWHWIDLAIKFSKVKFLLVDFSVVNLRICRILMPPKEYPNVLCLQCDVADIPIASCTSDFCWSVQVLQHLPPEKRKMALKEIIRIQKKGAAFYIAWLRSVPLERLIYFLFGKEYHYKGYRKNGVFLQRFDKEIESELRGLFGKFELGYSETLFHRDLKIAPKGKWAGNFDLILSRTFLAFFFARQREVFGRFI